MYPCQHVTKKCLASSTSAEWQIMQLSNTCLGMSLFPSADQYNKSSIPVHTLDLTIGPSTLSIAALHEIARLFSLQNKPTGPATNPYSHHAATEEVEEFNPFGAAASSKRSFRHRHRLAFQSISHATQRRGTKDMNIAYNPHNTSAVTPRWIMSCHADGGRGSRGA